MEGPPGSNLQIQRDDHKKRERGFEPIVREEPAVICR